jgi:hypothetical protein
MLGFVWAIATFSFAIPLFLVGLAAGMFQEGSSSQLSFSALIALSVLVFVMVAVGSIVARRQRRMATLWSPWTVGVSWALTTTACLVLFYLAVFTGVVTADPPLLWLLPPDAFGIPVVVFCVVTVGTILLRRSRTAAAQRAKSNL